jgi:hypothetical protein
MSRTPYEKHESSWTMSVSEKPLLSPSAEALTGHLAEHSELATRIGERAGLTVVASDPWSGTSALLASLAADDSQAVLVDCRRAHDTLDLAGVVADAAVAKLDEDAYSAWLDVDLYASAAGRMLSRKLGPSGVDLEELHHTSGPALVRLRDAFELVTVLAPSPVVVLDHLGSLLAAQPKGERDAIVSELRALRQAHRTLDLVLVEHAATGVLGRALRSAEHPLYQAGKLVRIRRASAERIVSDLVITRAWTRVPQELLRQAATLAAGVPALTWRVVELAASEAHADADPAQQAFAGWQKLRELTEPITARQWDMLRRLHPSAQHVAAVLSFELPPYTTVPASKKTVNDALHRLGEIGLVWQPKPRQWALSDPLLAAFAREHAPTWVRQLRGRRLDSSH